MDLTKEETEHWALLEAEARQRGSSIASIESEKPKPMENRLVWKESPVKINPDAYEKKLEKRALQATVAKLQTDFLNFRENQELQTDILRIETKEQKEQIETLRQYVESLEQKIKQLNTKVVLLTDIQTSYLLDTQ